MKTTLILLTIVLSVYARSILRPNVANPFEINGLPGLKDSINFKQYSGYITVDKASQRRLFFWFVESQNDPAKDPVVLWLNGGPGCSSLGGFFTEHGPFRPNSDGQTLSINPSSWNRVANVLYLESPAGVGFSYSKNPNDYSVVGDARTADDVYRFLLQFFTQFPQFQSNPFYVSGESYGGHYVPTTVKRIRDGNAAGLASHINLAGFLVGNAWTSMPIDNAGAVFFWWSHALISDDSYKNIMSTCNFTHIGPLKRSADDNKCGQYTSDAMSSFNNIDIYDIYVDVCRSQSNKRIVDQYAKMGSPVHVAMAKAMSDINPPYQPCVENYMATYLNRAEVQRSIHATEVDYSWQMCSGMINYNYSDVEASVIPLYKEFIQAGDMKILVFSGDVDAIVPVTGTRAWLATLNLPIVKKWTSWSLSGQTGGFVTEYDGLTFATVRGAGHMVPETQPERAFALFSRFLSKGNLNE